MSTKLCIRLILVAVIAVLALVLSGETAAADQRPLACSAGDYIITPVGYGVEFPYRSPGGCVTVTGTPEDCYVWTYNITGGNLEKVNKVHFFVPSFPPNVILGADIENYADHIFQRGEGGISTDFGDLNYSGIVISVTPVSGSGPGKELRIATKSVNTYGMVVPVVSTGKAQVGCVASDPPPDAQGPVGGIIGPGFDVPGFVPAQTDQKIQLGALGEVCAKRHPATGCIKEFYDCENGLTIVPASSPPSWIAGVLEDCGDLSGMNRHCRECIFLHHGSPGCYWAYANGSYFCLGCW